jgi:hypothetical protein
MVGASADTRIGRSGTAFSASARVGMIVTPINAVSASVAASIALRLG